MSDAVFALGDPKYNIMGLNLDIPGIGTGQIHPKPPEIGVIDPVSFSSMRGAGVLYKNREFITHTTLSHKHSAIKILSSLQKTSLFFAIFALGTGIYFNWHLVLVVIFSILVLLYFSDLLFNMAIIFRSFIINPEIIISTEQVKEINNETLPTFTILCPLYKEDAILPQFIGAMRNLDYPKDKLQIQLLLEEDDGDTINVARNLNLPSYFQINIVPHSQPKTKPKALNFGLSNATGEYIVIYDAEDIPETDQLKKAVLAFGKTKENVFCLQAKLNFYNPHQNILTRLFTAEYSTWFDLVLTGLHSIGAPIPLGGTSNFFRREDIASIKGWDAFNVCEDCDLGMRLFKKGHDTKLFNSTTFEEANSNLSSWIRQRSHWIKGYIQGFFVHVRSPKGFFRTITKPHFFTFLLIVGGKTLSVFVNPLLWVITLSYFVFRGTAGTFIESLFPASIFYMALFAMVIGNFIYLYNYMLGAAKRGYWSLIWYSYLIPFYWLLMSFAAWKAAYQLAVKPYYWEKTQHGLHLSKVA
jgi:glycosyltransferase XagB